MKRYSSGFYSDQVLSSGREAHAESLLRHCSMQSQGKIPWAIPAPRGHSRSGLSNEKPIEHCRFPHGPQAESPIDSAKKPMQGEIDVADVKNLTGSRGSELCLLVLSSETVICSAEMRRKRPGACGEVESHAAV